MIGLLLLVVLVAIGRWVPGPAVPATALPTGTSTAVVSPTAGVNSVLVEGLAGKPLYLNPLLAQLNPVDRDLTALLFSGLTRPGERGDVLPDLAERWEISGDGKVYTFYLRKNVKWHDGAAFSADDVVATIQALQDPAFPGVPSLGAFWRKFIVEKVDAQVVRFTLPEVYAPFLDATSMGILPAKRLAGLKGKALAEDSLNDTPIGTGPYRLKDAGDGQLILEANAAYFKGKPQITQIVFKLYRDQQSLVAALKRGEIMAAARILPEDVAGLKDLPGIALYSGPLAGYNLIFLNQKLPFFQDRATRQALLYALDRPKLIERVVAGQGSLIHSPILPNSWAYYAGIKRYDYDPEQAKSLLDKAGWKAAADGVRERSGVKLQFTLLTNDDPQRIQLIEEISRQWAAVGVKAETQSVGVYGLLSDYLKPRRFEALLYGWGNLPGDPDPYELWHSSQATGDGGNFAGFVNPKADEWIEDARHTNDQATRSKYYQQFQELFADNVPALLLYQPTYTYALNKSVQGFKAVPMSDPSERFRNVTEWTITK